MKKKKKSNLGITSQSTDSIKPKTWESFFSFLEESLGLNAMTISDLTGIPRPTVLRKLNKLIKAKWISKDKKGLYRMMPSEKNYKDLNVVRLKNVNKLSYMVSKFYNTARFIKT